MNAAQTHSRERGATSTRLSGIAILQKFEDDIVELDESRIQSLCATAQVWNFHCLWDEHVAVELELEASSAMGSAVLEYPNYLR